MGAITRDVRWAECMIDTRLHIFPIRSAHSPKAFVISYFSIFLGREEWVIKTRLFAMLITVRLSIHGDSVNVLFYVHCMGKRRRETRKREEKQNKRKKDSANGGR